MSTLRELASNNGSIATSSSESDSKTRPLIACDCMQSNNSCGGIVVAQSHEQTSISSHSLTLLLIFLESSLQPAVLPPMAGYISKDGPSDCS